jgi:lysyl-tRNA synthetase class 1
MNTDSLSLVHWADMTAARIIQQVGDKSGNDAYVLASGITPSGVVHFGNFRETITVDFVARALKSRGKKVRFIFSWDDYDTFRKIPPNFPQQEMLKNYMFQPIVDTPDPYGKDESYADHNEKEFMSQLKKVGIFPEPLYQAKKYRALEYNHAMLKTLLRAQTVRDILNQHREAPLDGQWWPISVYCEKCNTDRMKTKNFDCQESLRYECETCHHQGIENVLTSKRLKLPWRLDWPMRWAFEKVDFEPGGKDHSSQGGSYTTAKDLVAQVYDWRPPVYLQYDFVSFKGAGGKMSSSSGNVITVNDVLNIYEPMMVRWIFASYKSNVDFAVSFDLDVIKTYEDFDRMERLAYGLEEGNEKKVEMAKRVYQLSQVSDDEKQIPKSCPFQPSFRHLCNILQINDGDIDESKKYYSDEIKNSVDEQRYYLRAHCANFWIKHFAPEDFKFQLNKSPIHLELDPKQQQFMEKLTTFIADDWNQITTDKELHEKMYLFIHELELEPLTVFPIIYKKLINLEKGPKLAGFLRVIGRERSLSLLKNL